VCHHEQVALSINPRSSDGMRPERSNSRVRTCFALAAEFLALSTLEVRSCAKSELCRFHYA
jgi:hypothetical protein